MTVKTKSKTSDAREHLKAGSNVLKEYLNQSTAVPLFIPQTFINSLRDVGYNSTTSALCEHVDNSVQAGAKNIRIYFNQRGKRGEYQIDTVVYDDGKGMPPETLQLCMSFGGSTSFNNRTEIGRFGVGMKTAALSMSERLDVYSWVEPKAYYATSLDVNEIAESLTTSLSLEAPEFQRQLPNDIIRILSTQLDYPKSKQKILIKSKTDVDSFLGKSGTLVYMPNCDRLSYKTARTLVDHATAEMSRVYREHINSGVKIFINNRQLKATDPTYWMKGSIHSELEELQSMEEKYSKLINTWEIQIPLSENSEKTAPVSVRLYKLPYETWGSLPRSVLSKKLHLYDRNLVSVMRNDREVFCGVRPNIFPYHGDANWLRVKIDFSGELDEAFGVAMNKQGIRPKRYVEELIEDELGPDISRIRAEVSKWRRGKNQPKPEGGKQTEAERRAQEADAYQAKPIPNPKANTPEEKAEIAANIRGLSTTLKRKGETEEEAYERVKTSTYITTFIHDEYHPFYTVESKYGKVILKINKAHPFYSDLYSPLSAIVVEAISNSENADANIENSADDKKRVLTTLEMMLFSLGRTQTVLLSGDRSGEREQLYKQMHVEWSKTLENQLNTK